MRLTKQRFLYFIGVFFFFLEGRQAWGQSSTDTAILLQPIEIVSAKIRSQSVGTTTQHWAAEQLDKLPADHIADLLTAETGAFVKSYGQGALATSAVRGGSAGHTLVLWNGLPLQNPMLGLQDLSLLPLAAAETVGFTRGSNAAIWGSGAIGGVLNLDNEADYTHRIKVKSNTRAGSFGQFQQQLSLGIGSRKIQSVTRFSLQQADNDFYYIVAKDLPPKKQTHAELRQQWLLQDAYWQISESQSLTAHFWHQQSNRQIPPTIVQTNSKARQNDLADRLIVDYRHLLKKGLWQVKMGLFDEQVNYFDDLILLESRNRFRTLLTECSGQLAWRSNHQFFLGNTHTLTQAWSKGYQQNTPSEYKTALFASWKYHKKQLTTQFNIRQEWVDGKNVPIVPDAGFDLSLSASVVVKGKISRNYRLPTLNDRFWQPGGKPGLLPESGWSQELSLTYQKQLEQWHLEMSISVFNRVIKNWILWSLKEGQPFWSADNLTKVRSRGVEPRLAVSYSNKKIIIRLHGGYDYVRSTNQVALSSPLMSVGEQLIYVPVHQAFGAISIDWKSLGFACQHVFRGKTKGINDAIDAYLIGNVRLEFSRSINKYKATFFGNINNVWGGNYLVVERRPMPGRNFQVGLNLFFYHK